MITDVRIRAFRVTDDYDSCQKFIEGHRKVLEYHGIKKVTSANIAWANNPSVFVIAVESLDGEKLYGGARVHAVDGKHPLPIEEAVGSMDPKIHEIIKEHSLNGTGELCGLWNSVEIAGLGIGSVYSSIAAVTRVAQIGLKTMFALCSPATLSFSERNGGRVLSSIGMNGTFYYPKLDLLATAIFWDDLINLPTVHSIAKEKMLSLRNNPKQIITEKALLKKNSYINIHYDLVIESANIYEFKLSSHIYKDGKFT